MNWPSRFGPGVWELMNATDADSKASAISELSQVLDQFGLDFTIMAFGVLKKQRELQRELLDELHELRAELRHHAPHNARRRSSKRAQREVREPGDQQR
jgi:hypothetical protein